MAEGKFSEVQAKCLETRQRGEHASVFVGVAMAFERPLLEAAGEKVKGR